MCTAADLETKKSTEEQLAAFNFTKNFIVHHEKLLKCPLCNVRCRYRSIRSHIANHDLGNGGSCPKCGLQLLVNSSMINHVMSHLDFKPFSCLKCSKEIKHRRDMIEHLRRFHGIEYKCPYCGKHFQNYASIRKHIHAHTHTLRKDDLEWDLNEMKVLQSPDESFTDQCVKNDSSSDDECSDDIQIIETSENDTGSPFASNRFHSKYKTQSDNDDPSAETSSCTFGENFETETANYERNCSADYSTWDIQANLSEDCIQTSDETLSDECIEISDETEFMITKTEVETERGSPNCVGSSAFSLRPEIRSDVSSLESSHHNEFLQTGLPQDEQQGRCLSLWLERKESESLTQKQDRNSVTFLSMSEDDHTLQAHRIEPDWILNGDDTQYSVALLYEKLVVSNWMRMQLPLKI